MITMPIRCPGRRNSTQVWSKLAMLLTVAAAAVSVSCGGGSGAPKFSGNTMVTIVITGTANDQLSEFWLGVQNLTLTSQSGNTVNLVSALDQAEFIHLNGAIEPFVAVSIPQDVYTSASATMNRGAFTCLTLDPQGAVVASVYAYQGGPSPVPMDVTISLPEAITVTGISKTLLLNLQVAQSASYGSCYDPNGIPTFSISPTFTLTAASFGPQPANSENGEAFGVDGQISSIDIGTDSFVLTYLAPEQSRTVAVSTGTGTAYQGINGLAGLSVGTFIDMDGAIQADGSLLATRIAVEDPKATSVAAGPVLATSSAIPVFTVFPQRGDGILSSAGAEYVSFNSAIFQISSQLSNLNSLPFTPLFDGSNIIAGQNVYISTTATSIQPEPVYVPATIVTLIPQTINGTVASTSSSSNFTVYTVNLASYDLFPTFAVQQGQTTLLNNPRQVEVYVDSNTQLLNTESIASGNTLRFYGLVFNDHGTLRMDCAQVNDGVAENPQPSTSARAHMSNGQVKILRRDTVGLLRQTSRLITPAP